MSIVPDVSVLVPTRDRLDRLADCLDALVRQDLPPARLEILVGVDGPDAGEAALTGRLLAGGPAATVLSGPAAGPAVTRNRLIERARGSLLLLLNDDVIPAADCVRRHLEAHEAQAVAGRPAIVLGSAPWAVRSPDSMLDRLVRETSTIFFYDQMGGTGPGGPDRERDWGFRHGWTLNLSVRAEAVRAVGGFRTEMAHPVYEDLELVHRIQADAHLPVLHRPEAVVTHVHFYEPDGLLKRDAVLGHQAWRLAGIAPDCARAMFGTDVRSPGEIEYSRDFVERHERTARRHLPIVRSLAEMPATTIDGPWSGTLLAIAYEQTLLLRRFLWRRGLIAAAEGRSVEDAATWLRPAVRAVA